MTELELRKKYVATAEKYLGSDEGSAKHHEIIDIYNSIVPLPFNYTVQYWDDWCAAFTSAIAKICGFTDFIFPECGVGRMVELYKAAGRWEESDSYQPKAGDLIIYSSTTSSGDNTGEPAHVGIVVSCEGDTIRTIEGNVSETVAYMSNKTHAIYGMNVRGFCLPDYTSKASAPADSNAEAIWRFFMRKIGNAYGVAGLMGNLEAESGLHADRVQGDIPYSDFSKTYTKQVDAGTISEYDFVHNGPNGGGYGLAQWTFYARKQNLYDMYKIGGYKSIGDLSLACNYLWYELQHDFADVLETLKNATSVREASDAVLHDFESPADQSEAVENARAAMGQKFYNLYNDLQNPKRKSLSLLLMWAATRRK